MSSAPTLLIRADGGPGVGYGHLGRTLALCEAWVHGHGEVGLCSDHVPPEWERRWRAAGARIHDAESAADLPADAVAIDGYTLSPSELARARRPQTPVLQIDDHGLSRDHRSVSIIVDQNAGAKRSDYEGLSSTTRLLLGSRYLLLRSTTLAAARAERHVRPGRIAIFLGGDPAEEVVSLIDGAAARLRQANRSVSVVDGHREVPVSFGAAELAIVTAGSTTWDLAAIGVPMIVIPTADNQMPVAEALDSCHVAARFDVAGEPVALAALATQLLEDPSRRADMSDRGRSLVDGLGSARVATALRSELVVLRAAERRDAAQLWKWANDPATRSSAFDPSPIEWASHCAWLERRLADGRTCMGVGYGPDGAEIGQFRVDLDGRVGLVDVTVAPEQRGRGWAAPLIAAGAKWSTDVLRNLGLDRLEARVKPKNRRSARAFLAADFDRIADGHHGRTRWQAYIWRG